MWDKPTQILARAKKGKDKGRAALRSTPGTPPSHPAKNGVLPSAANGDWERNHPGSFSATEEVSTAYGEWEGCPQAAKAARNARGRLTWGRWEVSDRDP